MHGGDTPIGSMLESVTIVKALVEQPSNLDKQLTAQLLASFHGQFLFLRANLVPRQC